MSGNDLFDDLGGTGEPREAAIELDRESPSVDGTSETDGTRPRRPSRRRLIVLGSLLAVGLLGAGVLGSFGWRVAQQKDTRLDTPPAVAGLTRDDRAEARETADYLRDALSAGIDLDQSIGAVYVRQPDTARSVLLVGGTTLIWQPEADLDRLFELFADDTGAVTGLAEVDAGRFGGVMKCGTAATGQDALTVCGWADHGSTALAMFPGRDVDESARLLRDIRDGIQSRS
ncbi:MAG TPA: hypothetical protein VGD43_18820 [Micromonospora sp.]